MQTIGHFINGQAINEECQTQPIYNPSTGEVSKQVALGGSKTIDEAVIAAKAAFPAWRKTPPMKRARVMFKFKELLEKNADEICVVYEGEIVERGKHEELLALDGYYKKLNDMQSL